MASDEFADFCQDLTGFGSGTITVALQDVPYRIIIEDYVGSAAVAELLTRYSQLKNAGYSSQEIADALVQDSSAPQSSLLVSAILKLFFLGIWVQPFDATVKGIHYGKSEPPDFASGTPPTVVSMQTYENGLAWRAAQTHPTAISFDPNMTWGEPPKPLKGFIS